MIHFFWFPWGPEGLDHSRYENANREIVKGAWRSFGDGMRIHHMNSEERLDVAPGDVLLGHTAYPKPANGGWLAANRDKRCYAMVPWIDNRLNDEFVEQLLAARLVFAMCGSIWFDRTMQRASDDPLADIKEKIVRINMGCDANLMSFRHDTIGRARGFLHMSDLRAAKDPKFMYDLFEGVPATLVIGSAKQPQTSLPNMRYLGNINNANPAHEQLLVETSSFYIHTSWTDAQATAILENCARGLVPLLTRESGFESEYALYFRRGDMAYNRELVLHALKMPEEEYKRRSVGVRKQISEHHNWNRIYKRVEDVIRADMAGESFDRRGGSSS